jgi:hypothetical protein
MRGSMLILAAATLVASTPAIAAEVAAGPSYPLECKTGPVERTFGKLQWLVYSCADGKSIVIVAPAGSPAAPFYFSLTPDRLFGEGTGDKSATDAAFADIHSLSSEDVDGLIKATLSAKSSQ